MLDALTDFSFHCYACATNAPLGTVQHCAGCGAPYALRPRRYPATGIPDGPARSLWDFRALLPLPRDWEPVGLGEGATPLVNAPALARSRGTGEIRLKNEMGNPTGSYKDRQVAVGINWARACGHGTVAAVSSGNVAAAVAAYSARLGMRAVLFMHGQAGAAKIAQAHAYGATVVAVDDPSPKSVFDLCIAACRERGWYHLSTAGLFAPWNVEGAKTIAYELYQQYAGALPDWVVAPVGGGGLLGGIWRGFLDLKAMGLIDDMPRLAGVQAAGCAPLVEAIENDWTLAEHLEHPWATPDTIAGAIADDILFDGHTVLPAIRQTWGAAIAVTDADMLQARRDLGRQEGLLCEVASASAIAALPRLPLVDNTTRICCIVTGSGLKDLDQLTPGAGSVRRIPASLDALAAVPDLPPRA